MSKSEQDKSSGPNAAQSARQARLEEALRANLRRRKAQSRGRRADSADKPADSDIQAHDKD